MITLEEMDWLMGESELEWDSDIPGPDNNIQELRIAPLCITIYRYKPKMAFPFLHCITCDYIRHHVTDHMTYHVTILSDHIM